LNVPSCDNVTSTSGSTCNAGQQNIGVNVSDLSQNNQTLSGTYNCSGGSASTSASSSFSDSVDDVYSSAMPCYFAVRV